MDERIEFGLYQSCVNSRTCVCVLVAVVWVVKWGRGRGLGPGSGAVGWCYVCVSLDSLCRWQVQVSVYCAWRIPAHLGAPSVQSCCTLWISAF